MVQPIPRTTQKDSDLKERVRAFWQEHPCGSKFSDAEIGTREFFDRVEQHRYEKEWHIPAAANFASTRGLKVLEIGCGVGTDGLQFARAGATYTGVDLTEAAVDLARKNFESAGMPGQFRVSDAERLDFTDESFDIVYSHGVLHHTPDIEAALREIPKIAKRTGFLALLANLAMLCGLLGTVSGLIQSFGAVSGESVDPSQKARILAEGISEAMNCTAFGLIDAIIALVGFAVLNGKTQSLEDDIDESSVQVLNLVVNKRQKVNLSSVPAAA